MLLAAGCRKKPTSTTTLLHQAARAGNIEQIQSLVSKGTDINVKDWLDKTPLHYAAFYGYRDVAALLVANSANINVEDRGGPGAAA